MRGGQGAEARTPSFRCELLDVARLEVDGRTGSHLRVRTLPSWAGGLGSDAAAVRDGGSAEVAVSSGKDGQ